MSNREAITNEQCESKDVIARMLAYKGKCMKAYIGHEPE